MHDRAFLTLARGRGGGPSETEGGVGGRGPEEEGEHYWK